jgi:hypothetical protein
LAVGEVKTILDQFAYVASVEPDHASKIYVFLGNAIQTNLYRIRCEIIAAELCIWTKDTEDTEELEECARLLIDAVSETVHQAHLNGVDVTEAEESIDNIRTALLQLDIT